MARHRDFITRTIAVILTFALSTQIAEAQSAKCVIMSGMQANDHHPRVMQHQHSAHDAGYAVNRTDGSRHRSSENAGCDQTMLCANVAVGPTTQMGAFHFDNAAPQIPFGTGLLQARTLSPDPPPPRI